MGVAFAQHNLQHSHDGTAEMVRWLSGREAAIALVQEPLINRGGGMSGFGPGIEVTCGSNKSSRTAVLSKNGCVWPYRRFSDRDVTVVVANFRGVEVYVASVYCDITMDRLPAKLIELMDQHREKAFIIGMDSNAHSSLWNCEDTDGRGEMVEHFIGQYNLHVLNTGTTCTFQSGVGSSIIDITLCSAELLGFVQDWRVASSFCFSDHRRITFSLMNCIPVPNKPFNLGKCN